MIDTTATGSDRLTVRKDSPLCGDVIDLTVELVGDRVVTATHRARACTLVNASAQLLETAVSGRSFEDARVLGGRVDRAVRGLGPLPDGFETLAPVLFMPSRRGCVLLPWNALLSALDEHEAGSVST